MIAVNSDCWRQYVSTYCDTGIGRTWLPCFTLAVGFCSILYLYSMNIASEWWCLCARTCCLCCFYLVFPLQSNPSCVSERIPRSVWGVEGLGLIWASFFLWWKTRTVSDYLLLNFVPCLISCCRFPDAASSFSTILQSFENNQIPSEKQWRGGWTRP